MGFEPSLGYDQPIRSERIDPNSIVNKEAETDIFGLKCDGVYKHGISEFPIFDVNKKDFFTNMETNRSRVRFDTNSKASKYMRMTRNTSTPFYIRHTDEVGKTFIRRIK